MVQVMTLPGPLTLTLHQCLEHSVSLPDALEGDPETGGAWAGAHGIRRSGEPGPGGYPGPGRELRRAQAGEALGLQ